MCQDWPAWPSFPLEINILRKQQWLSSLLREKTHHPKARWVQTLLNSLYHDGKSQVDKMSEKKPQPKSKKTPPCLSECDKEIFSALIWKMRQRPTSCSFVQGCLFINVSTMRRLLPNLCFLQHGLQGQQGLQVVQEQPWEPPGQCWEDAVDIEHNPVHSATETPGRARLSSDLQAQLQQIQWRSQMMTAPFEIESWGGN